VMRGESLPQGARFEIHLPPLPRPKPKSRKVHNARRTT
jgi:hypothetical protein